MSERQAQPTEQASHAIRYARVAASETGSAMVEPEHLMLGILHDEHSDARVALREREIAPDRLCRALKAMLGSVDNPKGSIIPSSLDAIPLSATSQEVLKYAAQVAHKKSNSFVGPRHILVALFALSPPRLAAFWESHGISASENNAILEAVPEPMVSEDWREGDTTSSAPEKTTSTWGRFSEKAQKAVALAQVEAGRAESNVVLPVYLLAGILQQEHTVAEEVLRRCGVDRGTLRASLIDILESKPAPGNMLLHRSAKQVIDKSQQYSQQFADDYIGTDHLFLGLLADRGKTGKLLRAHGLTTARFLAQLRTVRHNKNIQVMRFQSLAISIVTWIVVLGLLLLLVYLRGC